MKRIVGLSSRKKKSDTTEQPPQRGLDDIVESDCDSEKNLTYLLYKANRKAVGIEQQILECDLELRKISQQMKSLPAGFSRQSLQTKAKSVLLRKKRFEQQVDNLREKSFNIDSLASSLNAAEDVKILAGAMKSGTKELKKQLNKIDIDKIEDLQEDLIDLTDMTETIQAAMTRNYDVPVDIDDDELNTQLELLGDEIVQDNDPSYMDIALRPGSGSPGSSNREGGNRKTGKFSSDSAVETDEFGLPILNCEAEAANANTPDGSQKSSQNNTTHL